MTSFITTHKEPMIQINPINKNQKLLYCNERAISDQEIEQIMKKEPENMTDDEKLQWKLEIQRQVDKTDEYLSERIKFIENEKEKSQKLRKDSKNIIDSYSSAVAKISEAALTARRMYFLDQPDHSKNKKNSNEILPDIRKPWQYLFKKPIRNFKVRKQQNSQSGLRKPETQKKLYFSNISKVASSSNLNENQVLSNIMEIDNESNYQSSNVFNRLSNQFHYKKHTCNNHISDNQQDYESHKRAVSSQQRQLQHYPEISKSNQLPLYPRTSLQHSSSKNTIASSQSKYSSCSGQQQSLSSRKGTE